MTNIDPGYYVIKKDGEPDKQVDHNELSAWLDSQNGLGNKEVNDPNNNTPGRHCFSDNSSYEPR
jgi:hypothetical protein